MKRPAFGVLSIFVLVLTANCSLHDNLVVDPNFIGDPSFGLLLTPEPTVKKSPQEIAKTNGIVYLEMIIGPESNRVSSASGLMVRYNGRPHIVSAGHICKGVKYSAIYAYLSEGQVKPEEVEIIAVSELVDVALLKFKNPDFAYHKPYPPLGVSTILEPGQKVFAVGYPYGFSITITEGIITTRYVGPNYTIVTQPEWLFHSAVLNPGNSGGPLFDECGRVIGINIKGFHLPRWLGIGDTTMPIAVPIDDVKLVLRRLKKSGHVEHPMIGLSKVHHTKDLNDLDFAEKKIKRPEREGWMIYQIFEHSQAEMAGLKVGDIILEYNGRIPKHYIDIARYIMLECVAGQEIVFKVGRFGQEKIIKVITESREEFEKRKKAKEKEKTREEIKKLEKKLPH